MADPTHSIRAQQLQIDVSSEAVALALQPRMSDLNRQRLLPLIERVLGELDVPGRHIRLGRVAIDLGELPLAGLEEAAEAALYDALHRSLRAAIDDQEIAGDAASAGGPEDALIELLAQYLQRGTLPFWAASVGMPRGGFSAAGLVQKLATGAPSELAAMIRRVGREPYVLERLVLALDETTLQSLLRLLEPAHAALILAYMLDLRHIHRTEPILSLGETAFERHLWILTLSYLVRDPGTQFNRKSFVAALLQGMAQGEGLDYRNLVTTLERGLRMTLRHLPLASSLPAVIREIASDLEGAPTADASADGALPAGDSDADPSALAALIRRYASDRQMLERLISRLDETTLQDVLRLLEPVHAALIVAYLLDLRHFHRAEPLLPLGEVEFARVLWVVTFSYLGRDAGSQFNRRSFVRALLEGLARSEDLDYAALIATLARSLASTAIRRPLASSLPAVIDEIVRDINSTGAASVAVQPGEVFADTDPLKLAEFIRRYGEDRWRIERLVSRLDEATLETVLRSLEPTQAEVAISYLLDLRRVHRAAPLLPQGDGAFGRLLWVLTLSYLARKASTQFDPKGFARALLEGMAQSEGRASGALLTMLADGLRVATGNQLTAWPLLEVIEALSLEAPRVSAVTEGSAAAVERYVRLDALAHFLRHGVLPIDVLLHRRDLNAEVLLADLPGFSVARLRALFAAFSADERERALLRAVRALSADALATWLRRMLPPPAAQESPLSAALAAAAAASSHADIFYAHFIAALIDGGELDLEAISTAAAPPLPEEAPEWADRATWPASHLQAVLLAGLRGDDMGGVAFDWIELLDVLLTRHPAEARSFLYAVSTSSDRDALMSRLPRSLFDRLFALMRPAEAQVLEFLLTAISELPMSERSVSDVALRRAILVETLRVGSGPGTPRELMARILRAAFGQRVPAPAAHHLIEAAGRAALPEAARTDLAKLLLAEPGTAPDSDAPVMAMRDALFAWLQAPDAEAGLSLDVLLGALPEIIESFPDEVRAFLTRHGGNPALRDRWTQRLPEAALARLIHAMEPGRFRFFIDGAELLHEASVEIAVASHRSLPQRAAMWSALLAYLAATPAAERSIRGLVASIIAQSKDDHEALRQSATHMARAENRQSLVDALARERPGAASTEAPAPPARKAPKPLRAKTAFGMDESEVPEGEPIYIDNAGLALAGVFLPHLFRTLDFLVPGETGQMRDHDTASRAVHLLQYLVDGRCSAPEPLLVLNKIMCGVPVEAPIVREIIPTEHERTLCDSLLSAMITRWEIIQSSSTEALRETFLKREGRLVRKTDAWELRVDRKTVDVLVDRVPWNVGLIYNSWMQQPLHVTW